MDKSREDSPKHTSRLYAYLQTCTGLVWSFLIKSVVETFVMSVDENLSCDNIHIKPYQLSLGAQLLSLFISIFHKKNHN